MIVHNTWLYVLMLPTWNIVSHSPGALHHCLTAFSPFSKWGLKPYTEAVGCTAATNSHKYFVFCIFFAFNNMHTWNQLYSYSKKKLVVVEVKLFGNIMQLVKIRGWLWVSQIEGQISSANLFQITNNLIMLLNKRQHLSACKWYHLLLRFQEWL